MEEKAQRRQYLLAVSLGFYKHDLGYSAGIDIFLVSCLSEKNGTNFSLYHGECKSKEFLA